MSDKKKSILEEVKDAALDGVCEGLHISRRLANTNHYRAMERLLRAYKNMKRMEANPEEYGFFPTGKSHDISVAPPPGLGLRDKVEINELFVQSKENSFVRSMTRFAELDAVVRLFEKRPEFIIIRMYYFGEDVNGEDRGIEAKPYTFAEISEELSYIGIDWSERACRYRRANLVRDMTVQLFGIDGALSIESRENTQQMKHERKSERHDPEEAEE